MMWVLSVDGDQAIIHGVESKYEVEKISSPTYISFAFKGKGFSSHIILLRLVPIPERSLQTLCVV